MSFNCCSVFFGGHIGFNILKEAEMGSDSKDRLLFLRQAQSQWRQIDLSECDDVPDLIRVQSGKVRCLKISPDLRQMYAFMETVAKERGLVSDEVVMTQDPETAFKCSMLFFKYECLYHLFCMLMLEDAESLPENALFNLRHGFKPLMLSR